MAKAEDVSSLRDGSEVEHKIDPKVVSQTAHLTHVQHSINLYLVEWGDQTLL